MRCALSRTRSGSPRTPDPRSMTQLPITPQMRHGTLLRHLCCEHPRLECPLYPFLMDYMCLLPAYMVLIRTDCICLRCPPNMNWNFNLPELMCRVHSGPCEIYLRTRLDAVQGDWKGTSVLQLMNSDQRFAPTLGPSFLRLPQHVAGQSCAWKPDMHLFFG